jgi:hypothetical protein
LQTIKFGKIVSIYSNHILTFVDSDNNYFSCFFSDTDKSDYSLYLVYRDDKCCIVADNTKHVSTQRHDYNFNNIRFYQMCTGTEFICVDDGDIVRKNHIRPYTDAY